MSRLKIVLVLSRVTSVVIDTPMRWCWPVIGKQNMVFQFPWNFSVWKRILSIVTDKPFLKIITKIHSLVKTILDSEIVERMNEFTQERSHSNASSVIKHFLSPAVVKGMNELTQERNHSSASSVIKHFLNSPIVERMNELTQERNHTSVCRFCDARFSVSNNCRRHERKDH